MRRIADDPLWTHWRRRDPFLLVCQASFRNVSHPMLQRPVSSLSSVDEGACAKEPGPSVGP